MWNLKLNKQTNKQTKLSHHLTSHWSMATDTSEDIPVWYTRSILRPDHLSILLCPGPWAILYQYSYFTYLSFSSIFLQFSSVISRKRVFKFSGCDSRGRSGLVTRCPRVELIDPRSGGVCRGVPIVPMEKRRAQYHIPPSKRLFQTPPWGATHLQHICWTVILAVSKSWEILVFHDSNGFAQFQSKWGWGKELGPWHGLL